MIDIVRTLYIFISHFPVNVNTLSIITIHEMLIRRCNDLYQTFQKFYETNLDDLLQSRKIHSNKKKV